MYFEQTVKLFNAKYRLSSCLKPGSQAYFNETTTHSKTEQNRYIFYLFFCGLVKFHFCFYFKKFIPLFSFYTRNTEKYNHKSNVFIMNKLITKKVCNVNLLEEFIWMRTRRNAEYAAVSGRRASVAAHRHIQETMTTWVSRTGREAVTDRARATEPERRLHSVFTSLHSFVLKFHERLCSKI